MNITINKCLFIIYFFNMIVFANGSYISKFLKLLFIALASIRILKYGKFKWHMHYNWLLVLLSLAVLSYQWSVSKAYAISGIGTIALNSLCIILLLQLMLLTSDWNLFVPKCLAVLPVFMFGRLFITNGFSVFSGLRNIEGGQHNTLGMFAGLGAVLAIYLYFLTEKKNKKQIAFVVINLILCILSMSRKSFIYLLAPLLIAGIFTGKNISKRFKHFLYASLVVLSVLILVMNVPVLYQYVGKGIESAVKYLFWGSGDTSAAGRNTRIMFGIKMFQERPLLGWGAMNYNFLFANFESITGMYVADNNYIDMLVNFGIIGLSAYYFLHLSMVIRFLKKGKKNKLKYTLPFAILLTLIVADYGVSSYLYLHSQTYLAVIIFILQDEITKKEKKEQEYGNVEAIGEKSI